jgi:hypothetical protein
MTDTMPTLANGAAPAAPPAVPAPAQQIAPASAPVTPGSKAWAEMSPDARHAQLRGPENPRSCGHSPARDQREAAAARAPGQETPGAAPSGEPQAAPEPSADGAKFKVGKFEVSEGEIAAMMDRQAQDDLRKATVPPSADGYKAELPGDLKLPAVDKPKNSPGTVSAHDLLGIIDTEGQYHSGLIGRTVKSGVRAACV